MDIHVSRDRDKDYSIVEYTYRSRSGERRRSRILVNNQANLDGSFSYRNPPYVSYGGPLTSEIEEVLETKCRAFGYDITL